MRPKRIATSINILLDEQGDAYLGDFGLARMTATTVKLTASGVVGTPAPQLQAAPPLPRPRPWSSQTCKRFAARNTSSVR